MLSICFSATSFSRNQQIHKVDVSENITMTNAAQVLDKESSLSKERIILKAEGIDTNGLEAWSFAIANANNKINMVIS